MTLWLTLTLFTGVAALIVLAPFFFGGDGRDSPTSLEVYKDQLAEVDRDLAAGLIGKTEAASARLEIERRILAASRRKDTASERAMSPGWHYRMVTGVAAIVVLGSVGLYGAIGRPDLPTARPQTMASGGAGQQAGASAQAGAAPQGDVTALVKRIEKKAEENPNDAEAQRMLGWSYYNTSRFKESVAAYRRAADLQKDNPTLKALLGEAMVMEAGETVTDAAMAVFDQVLAISPNDERARFFKGVYKAQKGDMQGTLDEWIGLYKVAPDDVEWTADLRVRIEETAKKAGIDVSARLAEAKPAAKVAAAKPGPTPADVESAKQLKPEDQQAMVAGMVDRLASRLEASPKDAEGWIMLVRSRIVMKDADKARADLEKAKAIFADDPETQKRIAQAGEALGLGTSAANTGADSTSARAEPAAATSQTAEAGASAPARPGPTAADVDAAQHLKPEERRTMAAGMVDRLAGRLETEPKDPDGWIMLIRSRMVMKDADKARADLEKAKTVFADDPETQKRILQAAQDMGVALN